MKKQDIKKGQRNPLPSPAAIFLLMLALLLVSAMPAFSSYNISGQILGLCFNNTLIAGQMYNASSSELLAANSTYSNSTGRYRLGFPSSASEVNIILNATSTLCPGINATHTLSLPSSPGPLSYQASQNLTLSPNLILTKPIGATTNSTVNFSWQINFSGLALFDLFIYGEGSPISQENVPGKSAVQLLDDGYYNWSIAAKHSGRILNSDNKSFLLDSTPPDCSSSYLALQLLYLNSLISLSWSPCTDNIEIANYTISAKNLNTSSTQTYTSSTNSTSIILVSDGVYNITVCAKDLAGNTDCFRSTTKLDITPPAINRIIINPTPITEHTAEITVSVNATDLFGIKNVSGRIKLPGSSFMASENYTLSGGLYEKEYSSLNLIGKGIQNITFEICAKDKHNYTNCVQQNTTIETDNRPPEIDIILLPDTVYQNDNFTAIFNITDSDGDELKVTINNSDFKITSNGSRYRFDWVPKHTDIGNRTFMIRANDSYYSTPRIISIRVININDPPIYTGAASFTGYEHRKLIINLTAIDYDNDTIYFRTSSPVFPANPLTGQIIAYPTEQERGHNNITVFLNDAQSETNKSISIYIGYCGEGTCQSDYEDCLSCPEDCGACGQDGRTFLVPFRNCLESPIIFQAVRLVPRATCSPSGEIIDGREVCGPVSEVDISISLYYNNTFMEILNITSDEDGNASFVPQEEGLYRISYRSQSATDRSVNLHVRRCYPLGEQQDQDKNATTGTGKDKEEDEPKEVIEHPSPIKEKMNEIKGASFFLALVVLVLCSIIGFFFASDAYYRYKVTREPNNSFVKLYSKLLESLGQLKEAIQPYLSGTFSGLFSLGFLKKLRDKETSVEFEFISIAVNELSQFYNLITYSVLRHFYRKSIEEIIHIVDSIPLKTETIEQLALKLRQIGLEVAISGENLMSQQEMGSSGIRIKNAGLSLLDLELMFSKRSALVVLLDRQPIDGIAQVLPYVVVGYNIDSFFVQDYALGSKKRAIEKSLFLKAWDITGRKVVFARRK